MKKQTKFGTAASGAAVAALAALTFAAAAPAARADQAVVVGVNTYPSLKGADLNGCVADATEMAALLKNKYGFEVTAITDGAASKDKIIAAIRGVKGKIKPTEKFVFFFAGHGTVESDGGATLLPSDAQEGSEANDLRADLLASEIQSINAVSRTALLDSCFSGGMLRSLKRLGRPGLKTRSHTRASRGAATGGTKMLVKTNDADNPAPTGKICYFSAARANEQAGEDDFDGARHGVFTHYLTSKLTGGKDLWGDIQSAVGASVSSYMEDTQHPTLSPAYAGTVVFAGGGASPTPAPPSPTPPPAPKLDDLWELYNKDYPDPARVRLAMAPNMTTLRLKQDKLALSVTAGTDGYLVILDRDASKTMAVLYPESRNVDDAKVTAGQTIGLPEPGKKYTPDVVGSERVKALFFPTREAAEELLKALPANGSSINALRGKKARMLTKVADNGGGDFPFYTSDLIFEVVEK